jgi:succinate dehydrogenase hydrophobic anchor subunit
MKELFHNWILPMGTTIILVILIIFLILLIIDIFRE